MSFRDSHKALYFVGQKGIYVPRSTLYNQLRTVWQMSSNPGNVVTDPINGYNLTGVTTLGSTTPIHGSYMTPTGSPSSCSTDLVQSSCTISLWVYPTAVPTSGSSYQIALWLDSANVLYFGGGSTSNKQNLGLLANGTHVPGTKPLTLSAWNNVILTFGSGTIQTFVNGALDINTAQTFPSGGTFQFGGTNVSYLIPGNMDECYSWSRVLTGTEIAQLQTAFYPF